MVHFPLRNSGPFRLDAEEAFVPAAAVDAAELLEEDRGFEEVVFVEALLDKGLGGFDLGPDAVAVCF